MEHSDFITIGTHDGTMFVVLMSKGLNRCISQGEHRLSGPEGQSLDMSSKSL